MLLSTLLLSSCYTTQTIEHDNYVSLLDSYNRNYLGKTSSYIVNVCGAPDRIERLNDGTQIIIYEEYTSRTMGIAYGGIGTSNTSTTRHFAEFYISPSGYCNNIKTNHVENRPYYTTEKVENENIWYLILLLPLALLPFCIK